MEDNLEVMSSSRGYNIEAGLVCLLQGSWNLTGPLNFPPNFVLTDVEDSRTPDIGETDGRVRRTNGDGENLG